MTYFVYLGVSGLLARPQFHKHWVQQAPFSQVSSFLFLCIMPQWLDSTPNSLTSLHCSELSVELEKELNQQGTGVMESVFLTIPVITSIWGLSR